MASSIAFCWAVEPSPFRVPFAHAAPVPPLELLLAEPLALEPDPAVVVELLSEPQADRASEPTRAAPESRATRRLVRVFTVGTSPTAQGMGGLAAPVTVTVRSPGDAYLRPRVNEG